MIQCIDLCDSATFRGKHSLPGLKRINYIFGSNGAGKTTISKGIAKDGVGTPCQLSWHAGFPLERMVYNKDFIETNYSQVDELDGIFTLGQQEIDLVQKIEQQKEACDDIRAKIAELKDMLDGKEGESADGQPFIGKLEELENLEEEFKKTCWDVKTSHDAPFREVFKGLHRKEKFRDRALVEVKDNDSSLEKLEVLQERVELVFSPGQIPIALISAPAFGRLIELESTPVLAKKVVGKKDVDIAALIEKLGNSDWVKEGFEYLEQVPAKCPFCQQAAPKGLQDSLEEYFDETFVADTDSIATLKEDYEGATATLQSQIGEIIKNATKHLEVEDLKKEKEILDRILKANAEEIRVKQKEPSRVVKLDGITAKSKAILGLVEAANKAIKAHNQTITNSEKEKEKLEGQVWRYLIEVSLKKDLEAYEIKKAGIDKAIENLNKKIREKESDYQDAVRALQELEKKTTSVQPTIDEINKHLTSFGFEGFSLAVGSSASTYKLVRQNGESAKETLSEGEKTFVTFLYFYHLLKGNKDAAAVSANRVIVFDDPVSSLDSDVLHIVSCLIKRLFEDACAGTSPIKQIFILTHNTYFHKEVSYLGKMSVSPNDVTYWIVRKKDGESSVKNHAHNPVRTSYEMLWAEISDNHYSVHTIQNTMRRLLESSARLLGGVELKDIEKSFTGVELSICRALMCWVHDGSHFSHDDICISIEESAISMYLKVFEQIFEGCGHGRHYRMMMKKPNASNGAPPGKPGDG
jgi:wobble nucleotide-excising tRNase